MFALFIVPLVGRPQIEFLFASLMVAAGLIFYAIFVKCERQITAMGMYGKCESQITVMGMFDNCESQITFIGMHVTCESQITVMGIIRIMKVKS